MHIYPAPLYSYRFGIGRFTTVEEVDYTVDKCVEQVNHLRSMRYSTVVAVKLFTTCNIVLYGRWYKKELILRLYNGVNIEPALLFIVLQMFTH